MQLGLFKDLNQALSLIRDFRPKVPKNPLKHLLTYFSVEIPDQ